MLNTGWDRVKTWEAFIEWYFYYITIIIIIIIIIAVEHSVLIFIEIP